MTPVRFSPPFAPSPMSRALSAVALSALAATSLALPIAARAQTNDFYVSGGSGGGGRGGSGGSGGGHAGSGGSGDVIGGGGGGGAYIGDGSNSAEPGEDAPPAGLGGSGFNQFGQGTANPGSDAIGNNGGDGGSATLDTDADSLGNRDNITLTAGDSGQVALSGSTSGSGGDSTLSVTGDLTVNNDLTLNAGNSGSAPSLGSATSGSGGDATLTVDGTLSASRLEATSGTKGTTGGTSGAAGNVSLTAGTIDLSGANAASTVTAHDGNVTVTANTLKGNANAVAFATSTGMAGALTLDVGTLSGGAFSLTDNNANLSATIGTLDMTAGDVTLMLDGTDAARVRANGLAFGNGSTLTVTRAAPPDAMTAAGDISVNGKATYESPIAWDAKGKALAFDFSGITATNTATDVALKTTGSHVILDTATRLSVTNAQGLAPLALGGTYTLVEHTDGAFTSSAFDVTDGSVAHGLVANAGTSLTLFKNRIATPGDYVLGAGTYTAGYNTNESLTLDVGGTLSVAGSGFSLVSGMGNAVFLSAGTLDLSTASGVSAIDTYGGLVRRWLSALLKGVSCSY